MEIEEKLNSLLKYRNDLDSTEQEIFDILIQYAREVMVTVNV